MAGFFLSFLLAKLKNEKPHFSGKPTTLTARVDMEHLTICCLFVWPFTKPESYVRLAGSACGMNDSYYTCCFRGAFWRLSFRARRLSCIQSSMSWPGGFVLLSGALARFLQSHNPNCVIRQKGIAGSAPDTNDSCSLATPSEIKN